ncbi:transglutaminase domain-containing protein [Microbacterium sp.]|uniref:transglutaminase domain-containing protein n=1 Tax=Microbacterium sp. TaxID=51671 RepID=UPI003A95376F
MSTGSVGRASRRDAATLRAPEVAVGTAYVLAMAVVAAVAAWPIYADARMLLVAGLATAAGLVISIAATVTRWPGWLTALAGLVAFAVVGVLVVVPPTGLGGVVASLRDVALGAVTGWKDLVTVDLPVGTYRNLLVPVLVVFLAGTLAALRLSWRHERAGTWAAAVALAMTAFGLLFGRTVTSEAVAVGPVVVPAPRELACGAAALVLSVVWLGWRNAAQRRRALQRAADVSGVRLARGRSGSDRRRAALAAGMVVVAVAAAAVVTPAVAAGRTRDVLRSATGPEQAISRAVTPLSDYRANFADGVADAPLFTVDPVEGALPERIRLATLADYDGTAYRVAPASAGAGFVRVPARLPGAAGTSSTVRVHVEGLRGIWMPTFGSLQQVRFDGSDAAATADAFYYDAGAEAGVLTRGLRSGDVYELTATTAPAPDVATLTAPGTTPTVTVPESVKTWIEKQDAGTGGAALATLAERLRERGYLSHALSVPAGGAEWMRPLGSSYVFQPSASGHSLARIDTMFRSLLARQAEDRPGALVAAPGDDEQFAVAIALVAEQLGFPARVVVGARLAAGPDDGPNDAPVCVDGACTGDDIIAWTEVRDVSGTWAPVDATPQHTEGAENVVTRQRDPENPTQVRAQNAQEVDPPDPTRQDSGDAAPRHTDDAVANDIWGVLRIAALAGLGLVVVGAPFAAVLAAKSVRRRGRRTDATPAGRMVGSWEEYVDAAVDHGLPAPGRRTRTELADAHGSVAAQALAGAADRAVFSDAPASDADADACWNVVDDERRRLAASVPLWRRVGAALSLRSFARGLAPRTAHGRTRGAARTLPGTERRGPAPHAAPAES